MPAHMGLQLSRRHRFLCGTRRGLRFNCCSRRLCVGGYNRENPEDSCCWYRDHRSCPATLTEQGEEAEGVTGTVQYGYLLFRRGRTPL